MEGRQRARDIYRQALPVVLLSLVAGLFSGTLLGTETMRTSIERVPGILLLLPAFLATRGGVYGSLGARLSSGLHQGVITPQLTLDRRIVNAIVASFVNGIIISVFIAVITYLVLLVSGTDGYLAQLVGIMLVAGGLSAVLMLSVLVVVVFVGYRRGLDPDNLIGPVVTTLGDVFGVAFLLVGIRAVEVIL